MKKSDLKTGMILEFVDGDLAMVLLGTNDGDIVSGDAWFSLDSRTDDLMFKYDGPYAVKTVYQPATNASYLGNGINKNHKIIWQRPEPKEMTLAEIEAVLGYPVKIIKEDKP